MKQNRQKNNRSLGEKSLELDMRNIQDSMHELMMMICLRPSEADFEILSIERPTFSTMPEPESNHPSRKTQKVLPFNNKKP